VHTALREVGDHEGKQQLSALRGSVPALKAQTVRGGGESLRHSRLPGNSTHCAEILCQAMRDIFCDLAPSLEQLPDNTPLALCLEINTQLAPDLVQLAWQTAWAASGIRHPVETVEGNGLAVVDDWLDQRIDDPALLLVIALQVAPLHPEGTGEAAVGVLMGNRLTQATLPPMAYLHRPQQECAPGQASLADAARQALGWVPLPAGDVERIGCVGIPLQRAVELNPVIHELALTPGLAPYCPDALIGSAGCASPWLAIAVATQAIADGAGPHFIFSGEGSVNTGLWCSAVMPAPSRPH
jgi:hypothetical protein